ncbi:signal transduction histidine kinase [Kibdelosporangium banguiense]|uniref:histidine kinase n=1 Tax=Kibdelosporangium banguiense TaxID=1365924 RepID=A0ABS4U0T7_9PSEU|nr:sensor histidine kinase [Kibdelosporangium banguiense]MBP2330262.1 signal transduction histidine kinase [Kibdelosporangium banguiense]
MHDRVRDPAVATACAVVVFALAVAERAPASLLVLAVMSVVTAAPLLLRRRMPLTVAVLTAELMLVVLWFPRWSGGLAAVVAFGSAAYHSPHIGRVFAVSAFCFVAPGLVGARSGSSVSAPSIVGFGTTPFTQALLIGIAPVAMGYALRLHHERAAQLVRLQQVEGQRAIADQRTRIAREVHDAVGHHLTAIQMQASAARHVLREVPPVADRALHTIEGSATSALRDVRTILALLPADGTMLIHAEALAARLATPSCDISVSVEGSLSGLPPAVDHGAYRLLQEALTNAVRHSGATHISVTIRRTPQTVTTTVEDNGPSTAFSAEGQGIRGMHERAQQLGGSVSIASRQPHGWQVEAVLPVSGITP